MASGLLIALVKGMKTTAYNFKGVRQKLTKRLLGVCMLGLTFFGCDVSLMPEESCNFLMSSQLKRVSWPKGKIPIYIHDSVPGEFSQAIKKAVGVWNAELKDHRIEIVGRISGTTYSSDDGYNVIYYIEDWKQVGVPGEQAKARLRYLGGTIHDADILINGSYVGGITPSHNHPSTDKIRVHNFYPGSGTPKSHETDLQSLMLHELGHVLGLDHTDFGGNYNSVMDRILDSGQERRKLGAVDQASLSCEYGNMNSWLRFKEAFL